MIPTFRSTLEEAIWANAYARFTTDLANMGGGAKTAWDLADRTVEAYRDESQRREFDKGTSHA